jgi:hypothetical protein
MKFCQVTGNGNTILWYYLFVPAGAQAFVFFDRGRLPNDMSGKITWNKLLKY